MKSLLLMSIILASPLQAKVETFQLETKQRLTLEYPDSWEGVQNLYGVPVTILGPWKNESRPVLTILPTGLKSSQYAKSDFDKILKDFKTEKETWIKSHEGKLLKFEPATAVQRGQYIGAEFMMSNIHFIERSYYLLCKEELFNLKYSIRAEHRPYLVELQKMVENFKCN